MRSIHLLLAPTLALSAVIALAACQPSDGAKTAPPAAAPAPVQADPAKGLPSGEFKLDPNHASVIFKVDHVGASRFTAQFRKFDAALILQPQKPAESSVTATIDVASLDTKTDPALAFDKTVTGPEFLDAGKFPTITFRSTAIEMTGPDTAKVTGDFTLHGVTKPLVLAAKFNGGYPAGGLDPSGARIGFSATGTLKRSDYGISYGIPAPGTKMGVSDEVEIIIEAEFSQAAPPQSSAKTPTQP